MDNELRQRLCQNEIFQFLITVFLVWFGFNGFHQAQAGFEEIATKSTGSISDVCYDDIFGRKVKIEPSPDKILVLYFESADNCSITSTVELAKERLKQFAKEFERLQKVCTVIVVIPNSSLLRSPIRLPSTGQDIYVNKSQELWEQYHSGSNLGAMIDLNPKWSIGFSYVVDNPDDLRGTIIRAFRDRFLPIKGSKMTRILKTAIKQPMIEGITEADNIPDNKVQVFGVYQTKVEPRLDLLRKLVSALARSQSDNFFDEKVDVADRYEKLAGRYTKLIDHKIRTKYDKIPWKWAECPIADAEKQSLHAAIRCWRQALAFSSNSREYLRSYLGNAHFDLGDYQQAVDHFIQVPVATRTPTGERNLVLAQFMSKLVADTLDFEGLRSWFSEVLNKSDKPIKQQLITELLIRFADSVDVKRLEQSPEENYKYLYSIGLEFKKRERHKLAICTFKLSENFSPIREKLNDYLSSVPCISLVPQSRTRFYIGETIRIDANAKNRYGIDLEEVKAVIGETWCVISWTIDGGEQENLKELDTSCVEFTPTSEGSVIITAYDGLNEGQIEVRVYDRAGVIVYTDEKLERKNRDGKVDVSYVNSVQEKLKGDLLNRKYKVKYLLPEEMQRLRQLLAGPRNQNIDVESLLRSNELSQERMNIAELSHLFVIGRVTVKIEKISEDDERFGDWTKAVTNVAFDAFDTTSFTLIAHEATNGRGIHSLEEVAIQYSLDEVYNKIALNFLEQLDNYRKSEEERIQAR